MTKNRNQKSTGNFSNSTKKKTNIEPKRKVRPPHLECYIISGVTQIIGDTVDGMTKLSDLKKGWNPSINKEGNIGWVIKI